MNYHDPRTIIGAAPWPALTHLRHLQRELQNWWLRCVERRRGRCALAQLDSAALRDIGVTRTEAQFECEKPFWRP